MELADQKDCSGYDIYNTRHLFCHLSRHALPNVDSHITNLRETRILTHGPVRN